MAPAVGAAIDGKLGKAALLEPREPEDQQPEPWQKNDPGLPDEVAIHFTKPPVLAHLSEQAYRDELAERVATLEANAANDRRLPGGPRLLGRKAVRRQSPFSFPKSVIERRGIRPRVATRNKWLRIALKQQSATFERRYDAALHRHRSGYKSVIFPYGTYKFHRLGFVSAEPAPT